MAQYTVTHSCGHQSSVSLFGPGAEREREIARMESNQCMECRLAAAKVERDGLCQLTGSDKQIVWATEIRALVLPGIWETVKALEAKIEAAIAAGTSTPDKIELARKHVADGVHGVRNISSASWWIDQRTNSALSILKAASVACPA